jgi:transposase-like protein
MEVKKTKKTHAHYEPDFKEEILRMLNSGKNVDEISKTFGIGRNVFGRRSVYLEKQIPNEDENQDLRGANDL